MSPWQEGWLAALEEVESNVRRMREDGESDLRSVLGLLHSLKKAEEGR